MKVRDKEEILGALARGYSDPKNEQKTVDHDLLRSMLKEVVKVVEKNYVKKNQ